MSLIEEVDERRKEIRTDGYSMSIGEWVSLYENNEIDIHPEFQRFFRWTDSQKTTLIESILLGIPIPPIFVSQRADGIWDVVDGLQRLSTIYQFLGVLRDEKKKMVEPLVLGETRYLPSLKEVSWASTSPENELPNDLKLLLKRSKISVSIILKESDTTAKFDLFQRLNTGGSNLSPQEVRNCILVMLNRDFFLWLKALASYKPFQECIALSERSINESYDVELALRFIIFALIEEKNLNAIGDVGNFLTEQMSAVARDKKFKKAAYESLFKSTFDLLASTLGDDAFRRYDKKRKRYMGGFLLSQYEVVVCGIAYNIANDTLNDDVKKIVPAIWGDRNYTDWSGAGMTATRRLPKLIPFGREIFCDEDSD